MFESAMHKELIGTRQLLEQRTKELQELRKLHKIIEEWRNEHRPSCAESLLQQDNVNNALPELAFQLLEIVGYYPED